MRIVEFSGAVTYVPVPPVTQSLPASAARGAIAGEESERRRIGSGEVNPVPLEEEQVAAIENLKVVGARRRVDETLVAPRLPLQENEIPSTVKFELMRVVNPVLVL